MIPASVLRPGALRSGPIPVRRPLHLSQAPAREGSLAEEGAAARRATLLRVQGALAVTTVAAAAATWVGIRSALYDKGLPRVAGYVTAAGGGVVGLVALGSMIGLPSLVEALNLSPGTPA